MGAARLEYKIIGKYTSGREITAYHVKCSNGKSSRVSKEQLYYLVGRGQVVNAKGQIYEDKVVLSGVGESLDSIPSKRDPMIDKQPAEKVAQPIQKEIGKQVNSAPVQQPRIQPTVEKAYKSKTTSRNQMLKLENIEPVMPSAFIRFCLNKEIHIIEYPCMVTHNEQNIKYQMNGELEIVKKDGTEIPIRVTLKKIYDESKSRDLGGTKYRYTCEIIFKDGRQQTLQTKTVGKSVTIGGSMFGYGNQKVTHKTEVDAEATAMEISNKFKEFLNTL